MQVISTCPSRASLFGSGTDLDSYALKYGGISISLAINLRTTLQIYTDNDMWDIHDEFPFLSDKFFLYNAAKLLYPASGGHDYKIISKFDGIVSSGLGSSASAILALVGAFNKRFKRNLTLDETIKLAYELESKYHLTGKQDHYTCAYGGVNVIEFRNKVKVTPLTKKFIEPILSSLVLVYIGGKHKKDSQESLRELTKDQKKTLDNIKELAIGSIDYIAKGDYLEVGKLLDIGWKLKKESNNNVTNQKIDDIYELALKSGAIGGKICGSGGAGYFLFIVTPEKKEYFIKKMSEKGLENVDFDISMDGLQTRII